MKSRWVAVTVLASVSLFGFCYVRHTSVAQAEEIEADFRTWSPSPAALKKSLAEAAARDPKAATLDEQQKLFVELFQNRFRHHYSDPMAVGLRFKPNDNLMLLCPARMEPWNMDRLAYQTWRETQDVFGHPYSVDLYVTYIGAPAKKVGELRPLPSDPQKVQITYLAEAPRKVGRRLGIGPTLASRP